MPPPSSRTGVPPRVSAPVNGLRLSAPAAGIAERPMPNALKAGLPCRKLWILDSKLLEDRDGSASVVRSISLCRARTRAEAGLEVWEGA